MSKKGDIILIPFPFTDLKSSKVRPALVIGSQGGDVIVLFITSAYKGSSEVTVTVAKSDINGLKDDSRIIVSKIATLDKKMILGKLGVVDSRHLLQINTKLKKFFKMD